MIGAEEVLLAGFTGVESIGRASSLEIIVPGLDRRLQSRVVVLPDELACIPILGHRDFLLNFFVGFDGANRAFYVSPARAR